ncbi:MAG: SusC/RagA family TonB-linked outer membrane protein, partial [Bacteroidota bacterium]
MLLLCLGFSLQAQLRFVNGTVTGTNEEPLAGVTVIRVGTNQGVLSGEDGSFSLQVLPQDTLRFSYYGYANRFVSVGSQRTFNISLDEDTRTTEEVVIVGFGEQRKESLVGAISTAKGEDLVKAAGGATNLSNALVGQVPGLTTIINSGEPGAEDAQLFIRGQSTWNGGAPLVLVDGIERPFTDIDPREVESISVLKDASATAVFGVKGANGVILITTKRGQAGKAQITATGNITLKELSRVPGVLDSYDALLVRNRAIVGELATNEPSWDFYTPMEVLDRYRDPAQGDLYPNVDWPSLVTNRFGWAQQANINLSGGTDFVKYFGALGYSNEGDIFNTEDIGQGYDPDFSYQRINFRSNFDFNVTPTTQVKANLSGWYGIKQIPTQGKDVGDDVIWKGLYEMPPDVYPVQYSNGFFGFDVNDGRYPNPYVGLNLDGIEKTSRTNIFTDLIIDQKLDFITKGLSLNGRVSFDNSFNTTGPNINEQGVVFMTVRAENPEDTLFIVPADNLTNNYNFVRTPFTIGNEGLDNNTIDRILTYQASLNYKRTFGKHNVSALALFQRREETPYRFRNQSLNINVIDQFSSRREDWVGRVTYGYDGRYLAEVNAAYNGSQNFIGDNRFAFFPSFGAGWVISEESFFAPLASQVSFMKIRYSYGQVGSDQGILRGQYLGGFGNSGGLSGFGFPNLQQGFPLRFEETIANPQLSWETATKQNVALELNLFQDLLSFTVDYYWEHRTGIFMSATQRNIPNYFGADPVAANIGETRTRGWEFQATLRKYYNNGFNFFARFNYNYARDEIIFREDPELAPEYQKLAGYQ